MSNFKLAATISQLRSNVLILLASYNGKKWIEEQINSILSQVDVDSVRILIRDDCSSDGTVSHIENLYGGDSRVTLLRAGEPSGTAGQNFFELIRVCDLKGIDYVAFCDQDDIWFDDKLSRAIKALRNSNSQGYSSAVKAFWPNGRTRILRQSSSYMPLDFLFEGAGQGCTFVIEIDAFECIKRSAINNRDILKNIYYHDWTAYFIVRILGKRWYFDSRPSMLYRQHSSNDTGARGSFGAALKRLKLIRSGWYKNQLNWYFLLVKRYKLPIIKLDEWILLNQSSATIINKARLMQFLLLNSRRKISDRVVLSLSLCFGWL